jgi:hypothetical protein
VFLDMEQYRGRASLVSSISLNSEGMILKRLNNIDTIRNIQKETRPAYMRTMAAEQGNVVNDDDNDNIP